MGRGAGGQIIRPQGPQQGQLLLARDLLGTQDKPTHTKIRPI